MVDQRSSPVYPQPIPPQPGPSSSAAQPGSVVPLCDRDRTSGYSAERIRLALALADAPVLRSLLSSCTPPLMPPTRIGSVSTRVSVPAGDLVVDGVIRFEAIQCTLATTDSKPPVDAFSEPQRRWRRWRYETPLSTLVREVSGDQAATVLSQAQLSPDQVHTILKLPHQAWHKSWWYSCRSSLPFQRYIRCRRYDDGTVTLQYKDYFEQEPPPCFHSQTQQALVVIQNAPQPFGQVLGQINRLRQRLAIQRVILISQTLKATEIEGFIRQNISLYPVLTLANPVNCAVCSCRDCPLQGQSNSPVTGCDRFSPSYG
ncbi:MAG: hypothetical protein ACFB5Z_03235 [Elainellaceae cyanobacterium]